MLAEAASFLTTPCPLYARRMGYLREAIAIGARYQRCHDAWLPHLDATKSLVLESVERCKQHRKAVVLGSGMLLDIPMAELVERFDRVILVDTVHFRSVRRAVRDMSNVDLVEGDVTGLAEALFTDPHTLFKPGPKFLLDEPGVDLVVSANLASQLPLVPLGFVQKRIDIDADTAHEFARDIVASHLEHLMSFDAVQCLVTERSRKAIDPNGDVLQESDTLYDLPLPEPGAKWTWELAPRGEVARDYSLVNTVFGYPDMREFVHAEAA